MGLRFAGTADKAAVAAVTSKILFFKQLREDNSPKSALRRPEKPILEMALGTACIALAMIQAGTGDLATLRLFRELRWKCDESLAYGVHMSFGCCLGLLFLDL